MADCPKCFSPPRRISGEKAKTLYDKLSPFLRVIPSFGCYLPKHEGRRVGCCSDWPLHYWDGPATWPVAAIWAPKEPGEKPSFRLFCRLYNLKIVEE